MLMQGGPLRVKIILQDNNRGQHVNITSSFWVTYFCPRIRFIVVTVYCGLCNFLSLQVLNTCYGSSHT
ncbi:hypothetical protein XELAEV_18034993mg [Xenopus laevis]|uniref:Uncharacterized protein n=1 Tax=Xenopus laevis TaxID=8355 RepID=A0A974CH20_XENLA|nr:hypothetical protein XELAEV_18034993mg [Xenopus laevis]